MKQFLYVLMLLIIFGCNNQEVKNQDSRKLVLDDLNLKYKAAKEFFGELYIEHFPNKITENNITFTETYSPEVGNLELMVIDTIASNETYRDIKKLELQALARYKANDSCLLVVNWFINNDNYYRVQPSKDELIEYNKKCFSDKLPIPNFWHNDYTTDSTVCKLPSDFLIFVLESQSGRFMSDKYLTNGKQMPQNWENGFSRGIAISEEKRVVIYWLIIW